jgi:hypothetical protein
MARVLRIQSRRITAQGTVVAHEHPGVNTEATTRAALAQRAHEGFSIFVILNNRLPPVPARHHMIDGPRKLDANLPCHRLRLC